MEIMVNIIPTLGSSSLLLLFFDSNKYLAKLIQINAFFDNPRFLHRQHLFLSFFLSLPSLNSTILLSHSRQALPALLLPRAPFQRLFRDDKYPGHNYPVFSFC